MFYFLVSVNIIAIILMLFNGILPFVKSSPKHSLHLLFMIFFPCCLWWEFHLELVHRVLVAEALTGLCIQYVGQAGFLMAFLGLHRSLEGIKIPPNYLFYSGSCKCNCAGGSNHWQNTILIL